MAFFLEYGEDQRFLIKVLVIIAGVAVAGVVILGLLAVKERIVYVNPSNVIGTAKVGYVPDEYVSYFGMTFIFFLGNANKYSVEEQYKSAMLLMSQQLESAVDARLMSEIKDIQQSNLSVETHPTAYYPVARGDNDMFTLSIEAIRTSYAFGQPGTPQKLLYTINCRTARTRKSDPFGLEVTNYDFKVIASGDNITAAPSAAPAVKQQ